MSFKRCPGSSALAQPRIEIVKCPACGGDAEVWSDEPSGTCTACGATAMRTSTQSCLDWCKYARECLGDEKYKQYESMKATVRKEALVAVASDRFGWGKRRLNSVWQLLERTEQRLRSCSEADPNVVFASVVIGFGCRGTSSGRSAEAIHAIARDVLGKLDYPPGFVEDVCELVAPADADAPANADASVVREALNNVG
ncbi:MAG: hypothetical protein ISS31_10775 [Kiritimatiellae bacterium]|nr:hypothetical protein [Kiritimatiellia bacterium]